MPLINFALKFLDCSRGSSERRNNPVCKRAGGSRGTWIRLLMGWTSETHKEILLSHRREARQSGPCSEEKPCFSLRRSEREDGQEERLKREQTEWRGKKREDTDPRLDSTRQELSGKTLNRTWELGTEFTHFTQNSEGVQGKLCPVPPLYFSISAMLRGSSANVLHGDVFSLSLRDVSKCLPYSSAVTIILIINHGN